MEVGEPGAARHRLSGYAVVGFAAAVVAALAAFAARPLATDDTWWHLAHGAAYAQQGPWLGEDPLLFTAPGPPAPASWLADVAFHAVLTATGFGGLRALHALLVLGIAALGYDLLRRAGGSREIAAAGCLVFALLSAYRWIQLRPELFTCLATLWLARHVLDPRLRRSVWRIAFVAALSALWSNLHAGFVLAPVWIAVALASLLLSAPFRDAHARREDRARAAALAWAWVASLLGSLVNPAGVLAYRPLLAAGDATPSLQRVGDEWASLALFALPDAATPGGAFAWGLAWVLLAATLFVGVRGVRGWRGAAAGPGLDPARIGLAVAALVAMVAAVRLSWLAIFPLLLLAEAARGARWPGRAAGVVALPLACAGVVLGFVELGDGRRMRSELPRHAEEYAEPFHAGRYFAHAAWLLEDAGVSGRLFAEYFLGGFHGYWLAPEVRTFVNGSLNVAPEAMALNLPLRAGRGALPDESFLELLDRVGIDLYLGTRLPEEGPAGRVWFFTTLHLEGQPGWIPIFRNLRSALYLRDDPRNREALARVAGWYARNGVPFDAKRGFPVERVIREAPAFAVAHGLLPRNVDALVAASHGPDAIPARQARDRLASIHAVLGLYDAALALDGDGSGADATALSLRRRMWCLLRSGRADLAFELAQRKASAPASLWQPLVAAAGRLRGRPAREVVRATSGLPFLTRREAQRTLQGFVHPPPRPPRS